MCHFELKWIYKSLMKIFELDYIFAIGKKFAINLKNIINKTYQNFQDYYFIP